MYNNICKLWGIIKLSSSLYDQALDLFRLHMKTCDMYEYFVARTGYQPWHTSLSLFYKTKEEEGETTDESKAGFTQR